MGGVVISADDLMDSQSCEFYLTYTKKDKVKPCGTLCLENIPHFKGAAFLEYVQAGMGITVAFAIDFTAANNAPTELKSLHDYSHPHQNNYVRAMLAVSNVVQEYDRTHRFAALGFGAVAPFTSGTSHLFPINGKPDNVCISGMQGVISAYTALLSTLRFSGPTSLPATITAVTQSARQVACAYTVLMILAAGPMDDMQHAIDAIAEADDAPLSIVIVGIGNADFSTMSRSNGHEKPLTRASSRAGRRDLVRFVTMSDFEGKDPALLAAALLKHVARQGGFEHHKPRQTGLLVVAARLTRMTFIVPLFIRLFNNHTAPSQLKYPRCMASVHCGGSCTPSGMPPPSVPHCSLP